MCSVAASGGSCWFSCMGLTSCRQCTDHDQSHSARQAGHRQLYPTAFALYQISCLPGHLDLRVKQAQPRLRFWRYQVSFAKRTQFENREAPRYEGPRCQHRSRHCETHPGLEQRIFRERRMSGSGQPDENAGEPQNDTRFCIEALGMCAHCRALGFHELTEDRERRKILLVGHVRMIRGKGKAAA